MATDISIIMVNYMLWFAYFFLKKKLLCLYFTWFHGYSSPVEIFIHLSLTCLISCHKTNRRRKEQSHIWCDIEQVCKIRSKANLTVNQNAVNRLMLMSEQNGWHLTDDIFQRISRIMITSWNGNIFRVTAPLLLGECTGHRQTPLSKDPEGKILIFSWSVT